MGEAQGRCWLPPPLLPALPCAPTSSRLPPRRCQRGAQKLRAALNQYWPDDREEPSQSLEGLKICPGTDFKARGGGRGRGVRFVMQGRWLMQPHGRAAHLWRHAPAPAQPATCLPARRRGAAAVAQSPTAAATRAACGSCFTPWPRACLTPTTAARCGWRRSRALFPTSSRWGLGALLLGQCWGSAGPRRSAGAAPALHGGPLT